MSRKPISYSFFYTFPRMIRHFMVNFNGFHEKYGLNRTQYHALSMLGFREGVNMSGLWQAMGMTKGNMTSIINHLLDLGYVEKRQNPSDRRNNLIYLSAKGREIYGETMQLIEDHMSNSLDRLDSEDSEQFRTAVRLLEELADRLDQNQGWDPKVSMTLENLV